MGETRKALLGPKRRHAHRRDQRTQLNRRDAQGANLPHTLNKTNAATSQCLCCQRDGLCSTQRKTNNQNNLLLLHFFFLPCPSSPFSPSPMFPPTFQLFFSSVSFSCPPPPLLRPRCFPVVHTTCTSRFSSEPLSRNRFAQDENGTLKHRT